MNGDEQQESTESSPTDLAVELRRQLETAGNRLLGTDVIGAEGERPA